MARAAAFVRYNGAEGTGHVGWAFDVNETQTDCGAVEDPLGLPSCDPAQMGFWDQSTTSPVLLMAQHSPSYDALKYVDLASGDVVAAQTTVAWIATQWYALISRNCMDDVYDVLRAYGIANLPPPVEHWFPNNWFSAFDGTLEPMTFSWGVAPPPGPASVAAKSIVSAPTAPAKIPAAPVWRVVGTPEWQDLQAQIAEQSGTPSVRMRAARFRALKSK